MKKMFFKRKQFVYFVSYTIISTKFGNGCGSGFIQRDNKLQRYEDIQELQNDIKEHLNEKDNAKIDDVVVMCYKEVK